MGSASSVSIEADYIAVPCYVDGSDEAEALSLEPVAVVQLYPSHEINHLRVSLSRRSNRLGLKL